MPVRFPDPEDATSPADAPTAGPRPVCSPTAPNAAGPPVDPNTEEARAERAHRAADLRVGRCQNPDCARRLPQAKVGRPRKYCTDACRLASRGSRRSRSAPRRAEHDGYAREIVRDICDRGAALGRVLAADDDVLARILEAHRLARDVDDLMAALVQQARDRRVPVRDIAALLNVSSDTVRRHWCSRPLSDRMLARRRRNSQQRPTPSGPGPADGRARARRPGPRVVDDSSLARFAGALSHLQRTSGKSLRALGRECGISASYVSRVLSGERCPSWEVACRLVSACAGDPAELHSLWEAARGYVTGAGARPGTQALRAALRGLHLAAARPQPAAVRLRTGGRLGVADVERLLHGDGLPDWETVDVFVHAMRGSCVPVRRIWNTALHESVTRNASSLHGAVSAGGAPGGGAATLPAGTVPTGRSTEAATPGPTGRPTVANEREDGRRGGRQPGGRQGGHCEGDRWSTAR